MAKLPDPKKFDDPDRLKQMAANAKRLGEDGLAWKCKARIAELAGFEHSDRLEREFWSAVSMAEQLKTEENGKTTKLTRTRQKYTRDGAKKCILDLALRGDFTEGFLVLYKNGFGHLTFEAAVLRNPDLFDDADIEAVRSKLNLEKIELTELKATP